MQLADAHLGLLASAIVAIGCGSGAGTPAGNNSGGSGGPLCAKNTVELTGMLDGASAHGPYSGPTTYLFTNALSSTIPGSLDVQFGTAGTLHLDWATLAADDQTVPATGTLTMPSEGPHAGQAYCIGAGSITPRAQAEGNGTSFVLTTMASGGCPGTTVSSSLAGCAAPSM